MNIMDRRLPDTIVNSKLPIVEKKKSVKKKIKHILSNTGELQERKSVCTVAVTHNIAGKTDDNKEYGNITKEEMMRLEKFAYNINKGNTLDFEKNIPNNVKPTTVETISKTIIIEKLALPMIVSKMKPIQFRKRSENNLRHVNEELFNKQYDDVLQREQLKRLQKSLYEQSVMCKKVEKDIKLLQEKNLSIKKKYNVSAKRLEELRHTLKNEQDNHDLEVTNIRIKRNEGYKKMQEDIFMLQKKLSYQKTLSEQLERMIKNSCKELTFVRAQTGYNSVLEERIESRIAYAKIKKASGVETKFVQDRHDNLQRDLKNMKYEREDLEYKIKILMSEVESLHKERENLKAIEQNRLTTQRIQEECEKNMEFEKNFAVEFDEVKFELDKIKKEYGQRNVDKEIGPLFDDCGNINVSDRLNLHTKIERKWMYYHELMVLKNKTEIENYNLNMKLGEEYANVESEMVSLQTLLESRRKEYEEEVIDLRVKSLTECKEAKTLIMNLNAELESEVEYTESLKSIKTEVQPTYLTIKQGGKEKNYQKELANQKIRNLEVEKQIDGLEMEVELQIEYIIGLEKILRLLRDYFINLKNAINRKILEYE